MSSTTRQIVTWAPSAMPGEPPSEVVTAVASPSGSAPEQKRELLGARLGPLRRSAPPRRRS